MLQRSTCFCAQSMWRYKIPLIIRKVVIGVNLNKLLIQPAQPDLSSCPGHESRPAQIVTIAAYWQLPRAEPTFETAQAVGRNGQRTGLSAI